MPTAMPRVNWSAWLRRWDLQQMVYLPHREERFTAMFDVVAASLPRRFRALDIGCGPGSLSQRLLRRFPQARSVAIDHDPVMLEIGRHALAPLARRLVWVDADLRRPDWGRHVPAGSYHVALSSTALHWLAHAELRRTYRIIHDLLRPNGLFLNADHMSYAERPTRVGRVAREAEAIWKARLPQRRGAETWTTWWLRLEQEPRLRSLFRERERRYGAGIARRGSSAQHDHPTSLPQHRAFLKAAGFREFGVVWSEFGNRVLLAIA